MTLYLIRHAQSLPKPPQHTSKRGLSPLGARQSQQLANLLGPLEIAHAVSSPFVRCLETAKPFAQKHALEVLIVDDLRERLITNDGDLPSDDMWCKSWEDFGFCEPGCETSLAAQARMCRAVADIAQRARGTTAIFTHGNVIGLFLHALTGTFGRKETEALTNPDVLKIEWDGRAFWWDSHFFLAGLDQIATDHKDTLVSIASQE